MKFHAFRICSILAIALSFAGAANAADRMVGARNDVTNAADAIAVASKAGKARMQKLAEASSALRQMAESLDDVASQVEESMERLAANQALQTAQANH